ncbi:MAG: DNA alkylation repair protein [Ardenticatenaceae bacterium]
MAEYQPLKFYINTAMARELGESIEQVYPDFALESFVEQVSSGLEALELKQRVAHMSAGLRNYLPAAYPEAVNLLVAILGAENPGEEGVFGEWYFLMPVAYFVEAYGLEHFEVSMAAMYEITKRHTSEFAIRPFLMRYPQRTLQMLHEWVEDENFHVRRLVSEGSRPRLPWGSQLRAFIEDPRPLLPLLEALKNDPSLYVRRSVANNLNDISKDHPKLVIETLVRWHQDASQETLWIIRHALRTLLKQGHPDALRLLGYGEPQLTLHHLRLEPPAIRLGNSLSISFTLQSESDDTQKLMIDYLVHFVKANGKTRPKVFKLSKKTLKSGETIDLQKKHTIKPITTRRYYPGTHRIEIQINGKIFGGAEFELEM